MSRFRILLVFVAIVAVSSCTTTNSDTMYDPNAPVAAIEVKTSGNIDPASRSIAIPAGEDELLAALRNAFLNDGWIVDTSTTNTRYMMSLQTKTWTNNQTLSSIDLSIVDQKNGAEILSGTRKTYGPFDNPIDVKAVADEVVSSLKKITSSGTD